MANISLRLRQPGSALSKQASNSFAGAGLSGSGEHVGGGSSAERSRGMVVKGREVDMERGFCIFTDASGQQIAINARLGGM
jgi:hypothetical protein